MAVDQLRLRFTIDRPGLAEMDLLHVPDCLLDDWREHCQAHNEQWADAGSLAGGRLFLRLESAGGIGNLRRARESDDRFGSR